MKNRVYAYVNKKSAWTCLILSIMLASTSVQAQQTTFINNYFENPFLVNPSFAGARETPTLFLVHQNALVGFPGSPIAQVITINGKMKKDNMGLGLKIVNEKLNFISLLTGQLTYSYLTKLNEKNHLSFGISLGISNQGILFDKLKAASPEESNIVNAVDQKSVIDGEFGVGYHFDYKIVAGFSVQNLFGNSVTYQNERGQNNFNFRKLRQYMMFGHYTFTTKNEQFSIRPIVSAGSIEGLPIWYNIGTHFIYKGNYMWGVGYKGNTALTSVVGIKVDDRLTFNYAFDYGINSSALARFTSHEILLAYEFSSTSSKAAPKKSKKSEMGDVSKEQFEQLDRLEETNNQLRNKIKKQQEQFDSNAKEIQELKEASASYAEEIKLVIANNLARMNDTVKDVEATTEEGNGYFVVMGSFKAFKNAKRHQAAIKRSLDVDAVIVQNESKTFYYVSIANYTKKKEALKELEKINKNGDYKKLIVGSDHSWLYLK
ncbi:MAG: PorP/SprF family type IX secretion system membrane protein [Bacteroidetes bacterium]|nr:PorP/SprF family type IX secretion system membrane protein [Bacteroidota bacterium]